MRAWRKRLCAAVASGATLLAGFSAGPVWAWDPATTQAGLTERALLSSSFHRVLSRRLGRSLGALEPLQLESRALAPEARSVLWERFQTLDPEGGYRPGADGIASALAWVTAGAVLAETPPERGRNHFFDPRTGKGLDQSQGLSGAAHAMRMVVDEGGSLRGLATGTTFDLTGKASLRWVLAPENDQGLAAFQEQLARSVSEAESGARESALVRALLALGGILAALQDVGEPAHVRNDFKGAFLQRQSASGWDRGSRFERFVADRYGRLGIPAAKDVVRRPNLESFFTASDGAGLADRTQRRFFSDGTVPAEVIVVDATTPKDVRQTAIDSLAYPAPTVGRLELRELGKRQYVERDGRRILAYERVPGRVRFFLDEAVYGDAARTLLPEVVGYAAGLADHLLRAGFGFTVEGRRVKVALEGVEGSAEGTLALYTEDGEGKRTRLAVPGASAEGRFAAGELFTVDVPAGAKKLAAVLRGTDGAGAVVAVGEIATP